MKFVMIRCEDQASQDAEGPSLLESSRAKHLLQLAQAGAIGTIRAHRRRKGKKGSPLNAHAGFLGLRNGDPESSVGRWYGAELGVDLEDGETVWCCDFVTHQDGRVIDADAGGIGTAEARELIGALNEELGSVTRRWIPGEGSHHALVLRGEITAEEARRAVSSPRTVMQAAWRRSLPRGSEAGGLRLLMEQAAKVLEAHPVNRVRVDLGENPANLIWIWSPAHRSPVRAFHQRTGRSGALVSSDFPVRGLAKVLSMSQRAGPKAYDESGLNQFEKQLRELIAKHDVVYAHLQIPAGEPVDRLIIIERLDRFVLKPLTEWLAETQPWRLTVLLDERRTQTIAFVAIGTGLPQRAATRLSAEEFTERGLDMNDASAFYDWFTHEGEAAQS